MSHVDDGTVHAYLDGELSAMEAVRVEKHSSECPTCRDRLAAARALIHRASQLLDAATPPVRAAPSFDELREPRLRWRVRFPLAWAATVILALGTGWYFGLARRAAPVAPEPPRTASLDTAKPLIVASRTEAAQARRDTVPALTRERVAADSQPVTGAVAMGERVAQPVTPANPPPAEERAAKQAEAPAARITARQPGADVAVAWPPVTSDSARALLGAEPLAIPGVPIRRIRASVLGDRVVLVEQPLDSSVVVYLYERSATPEPAPSAARKAAASELLARYIGSLRVEITAPLSADSLSRLLESLRPIR